MEFPATATIVIIIIDNIAVVQDLVQQNVQAAESALRQFQSCVRTTLLLSSGYECQEKVCHYWPNRLTVRLIFIMTQCMHITMEMQRLESRYAAQQCFRVQREGM